MRLSLVRAWEWVPSGRMAKTEDTAYCGLYLASEESFFITGSEIIWDGCFMVKGR
ncbi:MAG: SDR family oxidoreductase [Desulfobacteraceae bacterium]|nr:MAG: SDR family oxidoreductase [Desulfobacteraceae bacterium]